jgi:dsRNA-specific ribonuclease
MLLTDAEMAGKTPVSRLQELSSKLKLSAPEYELIFNRPEGLDPKFTYQCTFAGHVCKFRTVCANLSYFIFCATPFSAQGSGRTKRDAKHESAGQLLTMLPMLEADGDDAEQNAKTQWVALLAVVIYSDAYSDGC